MRREIVWHWSGWGLGGNIIFFFSFPKTKALVFLPFGDKRSIKLFFLPFLSDFPPVSYYHLEPEICVYVYAVCTSRRKRKKSSLSWRIKKNLLSLQVYYEDGVDDDDDDSNTFNNLSWTSFAFITRVRFYGHIYFTGFCVYVRVTWGTLLKNFVCYSWNVILLDTPYVVPLKEIGWKQKLCWLSDCIT